MTLTAPASGPVAPRTAPVTTQDLAALVSGTADSSWQDHVDAAISYVEARCGAIGDTDWIYLVRQRGSLALGLPAPGIGVVTSVVDPAGVDVTDSLTDADVDWTGAVIRAPHRQVGSWRVRVTTHRAAGDEELRQAVLLIAKHLLEMRRGQSVRQANYGGAGGGQLPTYSIPNRAKDLMAGHLLVRVA